MGDWVINVNWPLFFEGEKMTDQELDIWLKYLTDKFKKIGEQHLKVAEYCIKSRNKKGGQMTALVYIACPYTKGDVAVNVKNCFDAAGEVIKLGHIPYPPLWTHFWHLIDPQPYEYWLKFDEYYVSISSVVWRLPGESSGADREINQAISLNIPVVYSLDELQQKLGG